MSHILLVDDNIPLLSIQREVLLRAGHTVATATDGNTGLEMATAGDFDLVITDLVMPGKAGIDTIPELLRRRPGLKIIAVSGGGRIGNKSNLEVAKELGATLALEKPFRDTDLLRAVNTALGGAKA